MEDVKKKDQQLVKTIEDTKPTPRQEKNTLSATEQEILGLQNAYDAETKSITDAYDAYAGQVDATTQQTFDTIKLLKESQIRDVKELNQRTKEAYGRFGIRQGLARYAEESVQSTLNDVERRGLKRIGDIVNEESALLLEAQTAREDNQFSIFREKMNKLENIRIQKNTTVKTLQEEAIKQKQAAQDRLISATRESAIVGLYGQGLKTPMEIFEYVNFDEAGNMVGDISVQEIYDTLDKLKTPTEKFTGDYGEYTNLKDAGEFTGGFFDYVKKKKEAGQTVSSGGTGGGIAGGAVSGVVARDADSIMAGVLDPSKLSTKDNYAATVMSEVAKRKAKAKESGDIVGIIRASAGGKDTDAGFNQAFEKAVNVIGQISDLQRLFNEDDKFKYTNSEGEKVKFDMSPITAIWRSKNPYDEKAQAIKAQLTSIVPNLARGVYGEVGVLTDNDVKLYSKTLPNLSSTQEVRKLVLGLTIRSIQRSIENKIKINANRDLTHLEGVYLQVKKQADDLLAPFEAMTAKQELEDTTLPTSSTGGNSTDFWGNAQ